MIEAENGDAGIELATGAPAGMSSSPTCFMASGNGFQVCRALRGNDDLRHTKIVVVSGRHFEKDRQAAFKAGADEYVTKPIDADRLVLLLSRIVARRRWRGRAPAPAVSLAPGRPDVTFWGVRGSIPDAGPDHHPVRWQHFLCRSPRRRSDHYSRRRHGPAPARAPTGCRIQDQPLELTLLLTHTHWDHIQGLPFFLPVYRPQNHLRILGFEGARHGFRSRSGRPDGKPVLPDRPERGASHRPYRGTQGIEFNLGPVCVRAALPTIRGYASVTASLPRMVRSPTSPTTSYSIRAACPCAPTPGRTHPVPSPERK